jgi:hypothetical protein
MANPAIASADNNIFFINFFCTQGTKSKVREEGIMLLN